MAEPVSALDRPDPEMERAFVAALGRMSEEKLAAFTRFVEGKGHEKSVKAAREVAAWRSAGGLELDEGTGHGGAG